MNMHNWACFGQISIWCFKFVPMNTTQNRHGSSLIAAVADGSHLLLDRLVEQHLFSSLLAVINISSSYHSADSTMGPCSLPCSAPSLLLSPPAQHLGSSMWALDVASALLLSIRFSQTGALHPS